MWPGMTQQWPSRSVYLCDSYSVRDLAITYNYYVCYLIAQGSEQSASFALSIWVVGGMFCCSLTWGFRKSLRSMYQHVIVQNSCKMIVTDAKYDIV